MKLAHTVATPDTEDSGMLALRGDLATNFELLARLGYEGAEIMVRDPAQLDPARIKRLADGNGLGIPAVSTGQLRKEDGFQLTTSDPSNRIEAVCRLKAIIDFTGEVGAPQVNIGSLRGDLPRGEKRREAMQAASDCMNDVLDYAQQREIDIALEPQNRFVINWLNAPEEMLAWMDSFSQPNLSLLFDTYHVLFESTSFFASLIRASSRISHVQVSDSNRLAPGKGQFNFGEFVRSLDALGYGGFISVEIRPFPEPAQAAEDAARHLLPLLREIS